MQKERREQFETSSGIELPNDFNPDNTHPVDYDEDLGEPGEFPYTRGVRKNMYRGKVLDDAAVRRVSPPPQNRTSVTNIFFRRARRA